MALKGPERVVMGRFDTDQVTTRHIVNANSMVMTDFWFNHFNVFIAKAKTGFC
jgi:hypothetical protein